MLFNKIQFTTDWFPEKSQNIAFDFETRCICALFARLMRDRKLNFPAGRGVWIQLGPNKRDGHCPTEPAIFFDLESTHDIRKFADLGDLEKKKYTLDLIEWAMKQVEARLGFDISLFSVVYEEIRALKYVNSWEWKKGKKRSPDKKTTCQIYVDHEVRYFDIRARVHRDQVTISEAVVKSSDKPDEALIDGFLGSLVWTSETSLTLTSKIVGRAPIDFNIQQFSKSLPQ